MRRADFWETPRRGRSLRAAAIDVGGAIGAPGFGGGVLGPGLALAVVSLGGSRASEASRVLRMIAGKNVLNKGNKYLQIQEGAVRK